MCYENIPNLRVHSALWLSKGKHMVRNEISEVNYTIL